MLMLRNALKIEKEEALPSAQGNMNELEDRNTSVCVCVCVCENC